MRIPVWIIAISLLVLAGVATATLFHGHRGGPGREHAAREPVERTAVMAKAAERFQRFDGNADGTVTQAEWEEFHGGRFDMMDSNHDGTLSKDEARRAREVIRDYAPEHKS